MTDQQIKVVRSGWGTLHVLPDVEPALAALRAEGWKVGVLTNCDQILFAQTHRTFWEPFDLVVTADRVADDKPSLAHFQHFWRVTGVERRDWIHAACSWRHDIVPAQVMGIRAVWVDRERTGQDPRVATVRIEDAVGLGEAVKRLAGG